MKPLLLEKEHLGDRQNSPEHRRRLIAQAASRVFRDKGVHNAGMRDIAQEMQVSVGQLYIYFKTKSQLIAYCQADAISSLIQLAQNVRALEIDAQEKLNRLIEGHVNVLNSSPGSQAHLEIELIDPELRKQYEIHIREILLEGIEDGVFRGDLNIKIASMAILGAVNWTAKWYRPKPRGQKTASQIGKEFAQILVAGVSVPGKTWHGTQSSSLSISSSAQPMREALALLQTEEPPTQ